MEAKDYLRQHHQVDSERIGIYGRSKGAELVLAEESIFNDVQCLVLNSPSDVVYEGIKGNGTPILLLGRICKENFPIKSFDLEISV